MNINLSFLFFQKFQKVKAKSYPWDISHFSIYLCSRFNLLITNFHSFSSNIFLFINAVYGICFPTKQKFTLNTKKTEVCFKRIILKSWNLVLNFISCMSSKQVFTFLKKSKKQKFFFFFIKFISKREKGDQRKHNNPQF